jgi:enamine deaminase RidA (YjgF/YER057c/UK114 family)
MTIDKLQCASVPDLPGASWTNGYRLGHEVMMSGMTGHPATQQAAEKGQPLGAYEQTLVVLRKLEALVQAAGGHKHNIVKTVVYVTDVADKDEVGRARKDFFDGHYPCSTLVAVSGLVFPELRVEIDAWARLDVDLRQATLLATH